MKLRKLLPFAISLVLGLLAVPALLLAQEVNPLAPPDFKAVGTAAIVALTPVLGVVVLWGLKLGWSQVPASVVLFAAPVVGMAINYGLAYLTNHTPADPMLAALTGMASVYLREFGSTLASKGFAGEVTITKAMF